MRMNGRAAERLFANAVRGCEDALTVRHETIYRYSAAASSITAKTIAHRMSCSAQALSAPAARLRIPRQSGREFRFDVGHRSDLIPATIERTCSFGAGGKGLR